MEHFLLLASLCANLFFIFVATIKDNNIDHLKKRNIELTCEAIRLEEELFELEKKYEILKEKINQ